MNRATETVNWNPILDGPLRAQAEAAICEIAAAVPDSAAALPQNDASLAGGSAGLAVFHAYLACDGFGSEQAALSSIEHAMDAVSAVPLGPSLYGGITGIAWSMAHLRGWLLDSEDDVTGSIDDLLLESLHRKPWRREYDLIAGLVGFGVYALEKLPAPWAVECLVQVVDRLDELAESTPDGIAWFTPPELLPDWQRRECPNGYYNAGFAHGVPGVIAFLAQVCTIGAVGGIASQLRAKARPLLDGAVAWLLAQKSEDTTVSVFSSWIGPDIKREPSRVAWCYGDLGIAASLLVAARCVNDIRWEREAVSLARLVAERSPDRSGVNDCGLCHGAAGVGHLFNRMFQATGDAVLGEAARYWIQRSLEMRRPGQGIAGFAAWTLEGWKDEVGILEGAAGIALALLAAVTHVDPAWDRMLLVSMPRPLAKPQPPVNPKDFSRV